jgi:molecular chaperone GrpE
MSDSQEEFVPEDEVEEGPALVKKLRERLKKAVEEKQEYLEGWQRSRADFVNFKKEEAAARADKEDRIRISIIENLIPMLDTLEIGLKHEKNKTLEIVQKTFIDSLKRIGVERFGEIGEDFNPRIHEALAKEDNGEKIIRVERSGYKLNNHIIRPTQVII